MSDYLTSKRSVLLLVCSIIATLAVALRIWGRKIQKVCLELSDYLIVLGLIFALAEVIVYISNDRLTLLDKQEDYTTSGDLDKLISSSSILYSLAQVLWAVAVTLIRSSIILLYVRIFPTRYFRLTCYIVLVLNIAFFIGTVLTDCLICSPFACLWRDLVCSSCNNVGLWWILNASINLASDITVVLLPTPILWGLQMAVSKKAVLSAMFGLGIGICAITACRLQSTVAHGPDLLDVQAMFLMTGEAILGVLSACLPVMKPAIIKIGGCLKKLDCWNGPSISMKPGSIPIFMRVSHMWESRSGRRLGRDGMNSLIAMEDWRRDQSGGQSTAEAERVAGMKVPKIHVQQDIHVESASSQG